MFDVYVLGGVCVALQVQQGRVSVAVGSVDARATLWLWA